MSKFPSSLYPILFTCNICFVVILPCKVESGSVRVYAFVLEETTLSIFSFIWSFLTIDALLLTCSTCSLASIITGNTVITYLYIDLWIQTFLVEISISHVLFLSVADLVRSNYGYIIRIFRFTFADNACVCNPCNTRYSKAADWRTCDFVVFWDQFLSVFCFQACIKLLLDNILSRHFSTWLLQLLTSCCMALSNYLT